jgi:hypothetical protein
MAIGNPSLIGSNAVNPGGGGTTIAATGCVIPANSLVLVAVTACTNGAGDPGATITVSDGTNTYTQDVTALKTTVRSWSCSFYHASGSTKTITVTGLTSMSEAKIRVYSVASAATSSFFDTSGTTASLVSGSHTTTTVGNVAQADSLALFVCEQFSTTAWTTMPPTGYTQEADVSLGSRGEFAYKNGLSAGAPEAASWADATGANTAAVLAVYKGAVASNPVNTVAPAVTGTATIASTLTTTDGTWTGSPSPTFTYAWQRDVAGNSVYSNIASATANTYVLVAADDGCHVRCVVTGTNTGGNASANSNVVGLITYPVPTNTAAAVIAGTGVVGVPLTGTAGTWTP